MKKIFAAIGILFSVAIIGCKDTWDTHYGGRPETIDKNVWDAVQEDPNLSKFVELMEQNKLDTLFATDNVYSLFIPDNNAISALPDSIAMDSIALKYLISSFYIQSEAINGKKKLQTMSRKYSLFENIGGNKSLDGVEVNFESPSYSNGKFFITKEVVLPKQNLYQYLSQNRVLKEYIDEQDSVILDLINSKPLGFDDNGNMVYDSVLIIRNMFEEDYFPVKHEFRSKTATIIFPSADKYDEALDRMAVKLGSGYSNHNDVSTEWQKEILIPYLIDKGVFENMREEYEFIYSDTVLNIRGDSVIIDYRLAEKTICSNGFAYSYEEFEVPDTLYNSPVITEGEWLIENRGAGRYGWKSDVVVSTIPFAPEAEFVSTASNDTIMKVKFDNGYSGSFSLEFNSSSVFPRKYLMVISTNMDYGGIYDIYVNDKKVLTFDYDAYYGILQGAIKSVLGGNIYYRPTGRFNKFDCWVDNLTTYSKPRIRFEYKGPGKKVKYNGIFIDKIEFITEEQAKLIK